MVAKIYSVEPVDLSRWAVTGEFLDTTEPYWSKDHPHMGVDLNCWWGTTLRSPGEFEVVSFFNDGSFGIGICLFDAVHGLYTLFAHLSSSFVSVGDIVTPGQIIGATGNSGSGKPAAHLHWQLADNNSFFRSAVHNFDPLKAFFTEDEMTKDELDALIDAKLAERDAARLAEEIKVLGSSQLQATEALVRRSRAMGRPDTDTLEEIQKANDPNVIPDPSKPIVADDVKSGNLTDPI